jgi:hypothetical protein
MLIPKEADLTKFKNAAMKAAEATWGDKAGKVIAQLKGTKGWPFRDGDKEKPDMDGYKGHYFISAKSKTQPGIVDKRKQAILNVKDDVYAGCYARAELLAYAYDNDFGKGLGFSLLNLQKAGEGDKFGGRRNAEDVFDEIDDGSESPEQYSEEETSDAMGF